MFPKSCVNLAKDMGAPRSSMFVGASFKPGKSIQARKIPLLFQQNQRELF
jgi:hypothetical protein